MVLFDHLFCDKIFYKITLESKSFKDSYHRVQIIGILLKLILWYEFLDNLDAQSDFEKNFVTKKLVK